jgi:hypothetical protein
MTLNSQSNYATRSHIVKHLFLAHPHQPQAFTSYTTNNQQQQQYVLRGRVLYIMR